MITPQFQQSEEKPQPVFFVYPHILAMPVCICERKKIDLKHLGASPKVSYLHQLIPDLVFLCIRNEIRRQALWAEQLLPIVNRVYYLLGFSDLAVSPALPK